MDGGHDSPIGLDLAAGHRAGSMRWDDGRGALLQCRVGDRACGAAAAEDDQGQRCAGSARVAGVGRVGCGDRGGDGLLRTADPGESLDRGCGVGSGGGVSGMVYLRKTVVS